MYKWVPCCAGVASYCPQFQLHWGCIDERTENCCIYWRGRRHKEVPKLWIPIFLKLNFLTLSLFLWHLKQPHLSNAEYLGIDSDSYSAGNVYAHQCGFLCAHGFVPHEPELGTYWPVIYSCNTLLAASQKEGWSDTQTITGLRSRGEWPAFYQAG